MKKRLVKGSFLLILLPDIVRAGDFIFCGYTETGARATDESDYELELNDNAGWKLSAARGEYGKAKPDARYDQRMDWNARAGVEGNI
ncbi:MAG: hypothetical protein PHV60_02210 [bacterium]|nr:hypothetical protein [bacterium]